MDFDKIRPAVEEIRLSDESAARILEACKNKKRKKDRSYLLPVAVAAAIAVVALSPSFFINIIGAKSADNAECEVADRVPENGYGIIADEEKNYYYANSLNGGQSQSAGVCEPVESEIYAFIPSEISSLVSEEEYEEFLSQSDLTKGMLVVQFVEYFGIAKEDFDAVNKDENDNKFFDSEIIYTFDRELIDSFYGVK